MIPNIFHFIYLGGRPFSFIHYLAIYTACKVNRPERVYLHHTAQPEGPWWDMARPLVTLNQVEPVNSIHGKPVKHLAHMADVIRLEQLRQHGGIYLDLDVVSLRPLAPLRSHGCVMGVESGTGLCNAVIMAEKNAFFLQYWQESYRSFDGSLWNHHSVVLPWQLAQAHQGDIHVEGKYAFFYPTHNDPVHRYLWGQRPSLRELTSRVARNVARLLGQCITGPLDSIRLDFHRTFHALRGSEWHFRRAANSYCLHLWEGLWGEAYLRKVTPRYLREDNSHFARLIRQVISDDELRRMEVRQTSSRSPAVRYGSRIHTPE